MTTIKALARRQNSKRETWAADFVVGKGSGQIILLHGPLLSLPVADIGTVETRVERELLKWFSLAEAWNAVLLVDEADIFLERRQNRDLARNGLVSAFLRRMEYFKGLLFLTTNRVGQIDDAFISRVHVAIGYEALSPDSRAKIWQGFFRKLAKEKAGKIQISTGAKKWVLDRAASGESQMNGRDIRNALQTAITLAEAEHEEDPDFDAEKMTVIVGQSHFQRVLDITNKFHSYVYVQSIRREDERKRAAARQDRNDYWHMESQADP
ncbi:P-loop containing nucleoside triphosphate hydrolase protein [Microdochium trichocladiopsis]|uniref:P-loop containing nucleoside triphosphate hydrolase protein n=1 Tax=Microdochium trichocladiopsis TaxID=1682393 RepID=A0A9P8XS33_9PEZI|nr:P-loop containing nucleoside triphosphate hydrolase protein [Microdochium trichocladiopsis]KAH7014378.1 P-loop containing nucleoside triphosphate hydrolase protein [Microdochium trichocladiopsis]